MNKYHQISNIEISNGVLHLSVDGTKIEIKLVNVSSTFARASDAELTKFEVSPSGYGIHWPLIDEDISIDGLLGISHRRQSKPKTA